MERKSLKNIGKERDKILSEMPKEDRFNYIKICKSLGFLTMSQFYGYISRLYFNRYELFLQIYGEDVKGLSELKIKNPELKYIWKKIIGKTFYPNGFKGDKV